MNTRTEQEIKKLHQDAIIFEGLLMWGNLDSRKTLQDIIEGNIAGANYTVANHSHDFEGAI